MLQDRSKETVGMQEHQCSWVGIELVWAARALVGICIWLEMKRYQFCMVHAGGTADQTWRSTYLLSECTSRYICVLCTLQI